MGFEITAPPGAIGFGALSCMLRIDRLDQITIGKSNPALNDGLACNRQLRLLFPFTRLAYLTQTPDVKELKGGRIAHGDRLLPFNSKSDLPAITVAFNSKHRRAVRIMAAISYTVQLAVFLNQTFGSVLRTPTAFTTCTYTVSD